ETPVETETPVEMPLKTPEQILALLAANPNLTLSELALAIGKSTSAVERAAAKLVKEGRLRHVGPTKAGHWEILK
ncbi:MAG: winged helix-turn-helix transcriptional regulator, partial [Proteobacteria bacterium]|nr:winged helix-turn-helix transcriptional regulator [Pseudomonadota bacterium]